MNRPCLTCYGGFVQVGQDPVKNYHNYFHTLQPMESCLQDYNCLKYNEVSTMLKVGLMTT
jgi:hypothetical protein